MRRLWRSSLPGVLAGVLIGGAALAACTPSAPRDAAQVVANPALQQILQQIPADTPYAFVSVGSKGARDFMEKIYPALQKMAPQLGDTMLEALVTVGAQRLPPDRAALLKAIVHELKDRLSLAGLAELGLDVEARFAFYGLGVLPAMRLQLSDPAALRAAIERVQASSGVRFPTAKLGDVEYWHIRGDRVEGAVAIVGDQLVAGAAPVAHKDRVFALLLGTERPARHLGDSERFQQMLAEYDLARVSAGFVDGRLIAEAFLGEGDALGKDILAALAPAVAARWPGLDDTCKQEIRSLVALAPRIVFGTEQLDGDGFAGKFIVELRRDLAQELMAMRTSVPGLDLATTKHAALAIGAGLDLERALNFARDKATLVQTTPYSCPALAQVNQAAADALVELQGVDPQLRKARGFALVLDELKLTGMVPVESRGFVSLAYTDTKAVMRWLGSFTSQQLTDDGTISTLPDNKIPFLTGVTYGLQAGRGGVIAFGAESQARIQPLLAFPEQTDPPLMLMLYDMSRFADLLKEFTRAADSSPEMRMLDEFYRTFGAVAYDARATERGLVITTRMTLR